MYNQEKHIETIAGILARSVERSLTPDEQSILDEWLSESGGNREFYERLRDGKYLIEEHARYERTNYGDGWNELLQRINRRKKAALRRRIFRYAAASAAVAVAVWGIVGVFNREEQDSGIAAIKPGHSQAILEMEGGVVVPLSEEEFVPKPALAKHGISASGRNIVYNEDENEQTLPIENIPFHTLSVPRGGEFNVVLSDGTAVWLNSESSLRYPARFTGTERRVELVGEAYFEVSRTDGKQFVVSAEEVDIVVLGTEFNVMSHAGSGGVETTLVNGRVNIVTGTRVVALSPGRQACYDRDSETIDVRAVDTRIYTAWKDGMFEFDAMPLESICKLLGRWYNVDFVFAEPHVAQQTFTGMAKKDRSLLFILDLISDTQAIKYEMVDDKILLSMK